MGHRQLRVKRSVKNQVIVSVIWIALCSVFATVLTFFLVARFGSHGISNERYAVTGERLVKQLGAKVLLTSSQTLLNKAMPSTLVLYQVMNNSGKPIYGTLVRRQFYTGRNVVEQINVRNVKQGNNPFTSFVSTLIPITGVNGNLLGAVYLEYLVGWSPGWSQIWLQVVLVVLLLASPFIYISLFTYLFARRLSRNLNQPIQALIQAAKKIQERELDFSIHYEGQNEIGQLLRAFEDMRQGLQEALMRQWTLENERSDMLAAISHDVRTPLTIIQGHAEMLQEIPELPSHVRRYADTIFRNSQRVARLMSDFHTVTNIDSPHFMLKPHQISLPEFLRQKASEYEEWAKQNDVDMLLVQKDLRTEPTDVCVDSDRLAQILDNIMANAIRFTPAGGLIEWQVDIDSDQANVHVRDTGPGFHPEELEKAFRKFYQGDTSRTEGKDHVGLGLYIVKVLSEKHGGTINISNHPAGGAVVDFRIRFLTSECN